MDNTTLNFNIARRFDAGRGAQLSEGPQGPGLTYDLRFIHDPANPLGEAEDWLRRSRLSPPDKTPTLALVFGLGLGYHLKALRQRFPDIKLVVFEPIDGLKNTYDQNTVMTKSDGPAPSIYTDWAKFEKEAGREMVYGGHHGAVVVAPDPYKALKPEAYGAFSRFVESELLRGQVITRTRETTGGAYLKNMAENAGRLLSRPDLMLLKGRLPARPAFIVGAGPSLNKSLADLKSLGGKGFIIAAASAVKPLLAGGVRPDLVVVLESQDTSEFLSLNENERAILGDNAILALAAGCHPAHFEIQGFKQAVFHLGAGEAQVFSRGDFLPQGGNCGTAGFSLAYFWGLSPLVLVGQDQAYDNGRLHADGTPGQVVESEAEAFKIAGIGDSTVETNSGLLASVSWYAEAARSILGQANPPQLFNCSAAGAKVPGFAETPLSAVIASLPPAGPPLNLAEVLPRLPLPNKGETDKDLRQLAGLVGALRRLAAMDSKKAQKEIKEAGNLSKFLGRILEKAGEADNRQKLIAALDEADGLMTTMLMNINESD